MSHEFAYMAEDILEGVLSLFGTGSIFRIASYVLCALSIYTIADRRGIKKAWMAWVPVLNMWILGSISDQYRYVAKGEIKNKRKVLLAVRILNFVLSLLVSARVIATMIGLANQMLHGAGEDALVRTLFSGLGESMIISLPVLILGIVGFVFEIMALYDLYTSCQPANNVLYLVLSVIPGISHITKPLFLFLSRNQDQGMPPRKENPAEF